MNCKAHTLAGKRCSNTAKLPLDNPMYCAIKGHMKSIPNKHNKHNKHNIKNNNKKHVMNGGGCGCNSKSVDLSTILPELKGG